jgi:hypothetical protein
MALGPTQPAIEMSTSNLPRSKGRPARKSENLTAICGPTAKKMWEPQLPTILWASTVCYRDSVAYCPYTSVPWRRGEVAGCSHRFRRSGVSHYYYAHASSQTQSEARCRQIL